MKTHTAAKLKRQAYIAFFLCAVANRPALSQSPFTSGDNKGSVLLDKGSFVQLEVIDKAVTFGWQHDFASYVARQRKIGKPKNIHFVPVFGVGLRAALDNDRGSLFDGGQVSVGAELGINAGLSNLVSYQAPVEASALLTELTNAAQDVVETGGARKPSLWMKYEALRIADSTLEAARRNSATQAVLDGLIKVRADAFTDFDVVRRTLQNIDPAIKLEVDKLYPAKISAASKDLPPISRDVQQLNSLGGFSPNKRFVIEYLLLGDATSITDGDRDAFKRAMDHFRATGPGGVYWDQLNFRLGVSRAEYKFLAPSASFASQITKQQPKSLSAQVAYDIQLGAVGNQPSCVCIFGIAMGAEQRNNANTFKSIDIRDVVFTSTSDPNSAGTSTVRTGETTQKVLRGTYAEYSAFTLSTDFVYYPAAFNNRIAADVFGRFASGGAGVDRELSPGISAMLVQEGAPRKVVGGLSLSWQNGRNAKLDLVVGFNF